MVQRQDDQQALQDLINQLDGDVRSAAYDRRQQAIQLAMIRKHIQTSLVFNTAYSSELYYQFNNVYEVPFQGLPFSDSRCVVHYCGNQGAVDVNSSKFLTAHPRFNSVSASFRHFFVDYLRVKVVSPVNLRGPSTMATGSFEVATSIAGDVLNLDTYSSSQLARLGDYRTFKGDECPEILVECGKMYNASGHGFKDVGSPVQPYFPEGGLMVISKSRGLTNLDPTFYLDVTWFVRFKGYHG